MAAIQQLRMASMVSSFLPRLALPLRTTTLYGQQQQRSAIPSMAALAVALPAVFRGIPAILGDIWEGILRAVPKKKTSHMKKRHRQMAGKGLKDVTNLNKCPACGATKKMHTLCTNCLSKIMDTVDEYGQAGKYAATK